MKTRSTESLEARSARIRAVMNPELVARMFGCSVEQARAQYRANAEELAEMAAKAERTGRKVGGTTAEDLRKYEREMRETSTIGEKVSR